MDRNQATGLFLISALLLIYLGFFAPKGPKPKPADPKTTTSASTKSPAATSAAGRNVAATPLAPADSVSRAAQLGAFAPIGASDAGRSVILENNSLRLELSTRGGLPRTV